MEHKNDHINLDKLFQNAREEAPQVSFEDTKSEFLNSIAGVNAPTSSSRASGFFSSKIILLMTTSILTIAGISVMLLFTDTLPKTNEKPIISNPLEITNKKEFTPEVVAVPETSKQTFTGPTIVAKSQEVVVEPKKKIEEVTEPVELDISTLTKEPIAPLAPVVTDSVYHFPTFTEEEIKEISKQKSKMIKELMKLDKKKYAFISKGYWVNGEDSISLNAFSIQNTEVSNLEYRTFLFDLLIQNRKDDFLKAKPDQNQWNTEVAGYAEPMIEMYFSHPGFNMYPVNNISRQGAEMYCKWLTEETNTILVKKGKGRIADVRIPSSEEWEYAARGGLYRSAYPWGGPYARNAKGCYLANFMPEDGADADGSLHPVNVYSYAPNDYGLYCMSGNVAEMVYYHNDVKQPGTRGGGWTSSVDEIQINGFDRFKGVTTPNVNIGFRVVITYLGN